MLARYFLTVLFIGLLGACGGEFETTTKQVVGKGDADFPFKDGQVFVMSFPGGAISENLTKDRKKALSKPASERTAKEQLLLQHFTDELITEISEASTVFINPEAEHLKEGDLGEQKVKFKKVEHCMRNSSGDYKYYAFRSIGNDQYLVSTSTNGCFDYGSGGKHGLMMFSFDGELLKFFVIDKKHPEYQTIEEWAHGLSTFKKWWLDIESEMAFEKNAQGKVREEITVTLDNPDAYAEYLKDKKHTFSEFEIFYATSELAIENAANQDGVHKAITEYLIKEAKLK